jgi:hypothetical protein
LSTSFFMHEEVMKFRFLPLLTLPNCTGNRSANAPAVYTIADRGAVVFCKSSAFSRPQGYSSNTSLPGPPAPAS